jgi:hypothetical protein
VSVPRITQVEARLDRERGVVVALRAKRRAALGLELRPVRANGFVIGARRREGSTSAIAFAVPAPPGDPDAEGREEPGERMQQDLPEPEPPGERADVLPAGAAKADQHVIAGIDAARDADLDDRLSHVGVRDLDEARRDLLRAAREAGGGEGGLDLHEGALDGRAIEGGTGSGRAARGRGRSSRR